MTPAKIRERRQAIEAEHAERLAEAERSYSNTIRALQERLSGNLVRLLDEICAEPETAPPEPERAAPAPEPTQPSTSRRRSKPETKTEAPTPEPAPTNGAAHADVKPEIVAAAGPKAVVLCEHHGEPVDEFGSCPKCLF